MTRGGPGVIGARAGTNSCSKATCGGHNWVHDRVHALWKCLECGRREHSDGRVERGVDECESSVVFVDFFGLAQSA